MAETTFTEELGKLFYKYLRSEEMRQKVEDQIMNLIYDRYCGQSMLEIYQSLNSKKLITSSLNEELCYENGVKFSNWIYHYTQFREQNAKNKQKRRYDSAIFKNRIFIISMLVLNMPEDLKEAQVIKRMKIIFNE